MSKYLNIWGMIDPGRFLWNRRCDSRIKEKKLNVISNVVDLSEINTIEIDKQ